jgi:hypothetical protein
MVDMTDSTNLPQASATTSEADADDRGGSTSPDEPTVGGISDDQLPEDLQPGEDNPLAEPLDPDDEDTKSREELGMDETQSAMSPYSDVEEDAESSDDSGQESEDSGS